MIEVDINEVIKMNTIKVNSEAAAAGLGDPRLHPEELEQMSMQAYKRSFLSWLRSRLERLVPLLNNVI